MYQVFFLKVLITVFSLVCWEIIIWRKRKRIHNQQNQLSWEKSVLKNSAKVLIKHLRRSLSLNKGAGHSTTSLKKEFWKFSTGSFWAAIFAKTLKNPSRNVTFSKVVGLVILLYGCFSRFLNCTNRATHHFEILSNCKSINVWTDKRTSLSPCVRIIVFHL